MKGILKKIAIFAAVIGLGFSGYQLATAQYYTTTSNTSYYGGGYNGGWYGGNDYYGGIGSYTIGCTTYYYSTRTHRQLYTENICNNYQNNYQYYNYYNQYYPWYNGGWTNTGYGYGNGYGNCHYVSNNQMVCYQ